jgi:apolipoprotein N-acyltransferase
MSNNPLATTPRWVNYLLLLLAGALQTLSLSPWQWWWIGPLSTALIVFAALPLASRHLFLAGWMTGLGLFASGVTWIYISISEHGNTSIPIAVTLMVLFVAGVALVHGLAFWFWGKLAKHSQVRRLILFPAVWVLADWIRGWLLTGFPWSYLGTAHVDGPLAGWAPVTGVHGITLMVTATGAALYGLCWLIHTRQPARAAVVGVCTLAIWLAGPTLNRIQWTQVSEETLSFATMQGNIPQQMKWDPDFLRDQLVIYLGLTEDDWNRDIILWPETAIPITQDQAGPVIEHIQAKLGENSTLISGIPWYTYSGDREDYTFHNSIMAIGEPGEGVYHKQKLVPFGEYLPLETLLSGTIAFFDLPMPAMTPGPSEQTPIQAVGLTIGNAICYEIIYPDLVADRARSADLLLTVSNDTWFGASIGPLQHLQMARLRALENGRYLARATSNGVTAIIDPQGSVTAQAPRFEATSISGEVIPMAGLTPFGRTGSWPIWLLAGLLVIPGLRLRREP